MTDKSQGGSKGVSSTDEPGKRREPMNPWNYIWIFVVVVAIMVVGLVIAEGLM